MNECRSAFCFHVMQAEAAALRSASKNQGLLCGHTRAPLRSAIANQRERFSLSETVRRVAVFALCAATSMNPVQPQDFLGTNPANAAERNARRNLWRSVF